MIFGGKSIDLIEYSDIKRLVDEVEEGRTLDYKSMLPAEGEKGIRAFLDDVCSFANASGGYLIFGIHEHRGEGDDGRSVSIVGIEIEDRDEFVLKWQGRVSDLIEPAVIGHRMRIIDSPDGVLSVLVVHVPKSYLSPHWVNYKGRREFRTRHDRSNHLMELAEIRQAFIDGRTLPEALRDYRRERLSIISRGDAPSAPGPDDFALVVHIIPLSSLGEEAYVDVTKINAVMLPGTSLSGMPSRRLNIEGCLFRSGASQSNSDYQQFFRDGSTEVFFDGRSLVFERWGMKVVRGYMLEKLVISSVGQSLGILADIGVQPPFFIAISLLGARSLVLSMQDEAFLQERDHFDSDVVLAPPVTVESVSSDMSEVLKPALDVIWQASNWSGSPYYSEDGTRKERE